VGDFFPQSPPHCFFVLAIRLPVHERAKVTVEATEQVTGQVTTEVATEVTTEVATLLTAVRSSPDQDQRYR
jgi:hypothetical protein